MLIHPAFPHAQNNRAKAWPNTYKNSLTKNRQFKRSLQGTL